MFVVLFVTAVLVKFYVQIGIVLGVLVIGWWLYLRGKRQKLLRTGIQVIDRMKGRRFELYLQILFTAHGYSAKVTRASGDYGADLVLSRRGRKIVVQAKRHNQNVGVSAVQEVVASKKYYGADEAWVVTNRDYTASTYRLTSLNGVRLINRERLIKLMIIANPRMKRKPAEQDDIDLLPQ